MKRVLAPLLLGLLLAGCGSPEREAAGDDLAADLTPSPGMPDAGNAADPAANPHAHSAALDRLGPIRIGATLAALRAQGVAIDRSGEAMPGSDCAYASVATMPDMLLMLDGETVVRIDVRSARYPTIGGLRVGHGEAEARARLGPGATVQPHPYTGPQGHYLVLHEDGAPAGLIAETDGETVRSYRVGQWEQVQWVEGCA